ncbi:GNAT family N-acetyltransferase [Aliikangiella sp. IMCC44653]
MLKIEKARPQDSARIAMLAKPIWQEHYTPIIGAKQVNYMLEKFQSEEAIAAQINQNFAYYLVSYENQAAGYFATQKRDAHLFISKFYLLSVFRGLGLGKKMMRYVENLAQQQDCSHLELTVNKFNPAYQIYLKLNFVVKEAIQIDIGNGFIMDDYRMLKSL